MCTKRREVIYLACTPNLNYLYGVGEWEVFGLWFDARGTASKFLQDFFENHGLQRSDLEKICLSVLQNT
jgi:hypothetical protein